MTEIINTSPNYFNNGSTPINNEDRKLFIGGLSYDTTENDLYAYFGQFGSILNVTIKYNSQTGHPRGFGFVTFASDNSIDSVLSAGPHTIKNRQIDPRKAKTRPIVKKIFVGGLGSSVTEEEIRSYFSQFGSVENVELPYDHTRNRRREFCFVIFENEESADKACYEPKQNIGGRDVDIKKAQPQNVQKQNQRRNYNQNNSYGYNQSYGNGMNSYGNNEFGNSWRSERGGNGGGGGYRNQNSSYGNNGSYQKRGAPRSNTFNLQMNPIESSNNYYRQPDYM